MHRKVENKWTVICKFLEGRTDNTVKNHWNSAMKKKIADMTQAIEYYIQSMIKQSAKADIKNQRKEIEATYLKKLLAEVEV